MSVRFIDTCATPYSGMYQPMAFTALSVPGWVTSLPSGCFTLRPASRTSNAMA